MIPTDFWIIAILIPVMSVTVIMGKLTIPAALVGGLIGFLLFLSFGYLGISTMATFFVLGTMATSWQLNLKNKLGLAEEDKGKRRVGQVIANAGVAGIFALLAILEPERGDICQLMMAACFAAATADTLSSELGNIYGRNFYNILTLTKDERGLNGVISFEGTLFGVAGSAIIAVIYCALSDWNNRALIIIIAGTIGNISDSILGATLERSHYLNNNAVNFLNTAIGALTGWLLFSLT